MPVYMSALPLIAEVTQMTHAIDVALNQFAFAIVHKHTYVVVLVRHTLRMLRITLPVLTSKKSADGE
jgi:hypothetical protein